MPHRLDLLLGRRLRHDDQRATAKEPRGIGHALAVIAGRGAGHTRFVRTQPAQAVDGAACLERADGREILALEIHLAAEART